jgi:hypothetical protein
MCLLNCYRVCGLPPVSGSLIAKTIRTSPVLQNPTFAHYLEKPCIVLLSQTECFHPVFNFTHQRSKVDLIVILQSMIISSKRAILLILQLSFKYVYLLIFPATCSGHFIYVLYVFYVLSLATLLTYQDSEFCSQSAFVCFVFFSQ